MGVIDIFHSKGPITIINGVATCQKGIRSFNQNLSQLIAHRTKITTQCIGNISLLSDISISIFNNDNICRFTRLIQQAVYQLLGPINAASSFDNVVRKILPF